MHTAQDGAAVYCTNIYVSHSLASQIYAYLFNTGTTDLWLAFWTFMQNKPISIFLMLVQTKHIYQFLIHLQTKPMSTFLTLVQTKTIYNVLIHLLTLDMSAILTLSNQNSV